MKAAFLTNQQNQFFRSKYWYKLSTHFLLWCHKKNRGKTEKQGEDFDLRCDRMRSNYKTNYERYLKAALYINNIIYLAVSQ